MNEKQKDGLSRTRQRGHTVRSKSDRQYWVRWMIRNSSPRTNGSESRIKITLPRVAFLERPEVHPEI